MTMIAVMIGGGLGALLRQLFTQFFTQSTLLPIASGILVANGLGCFCIGLVYSLLGDQLSDTTRLFITTGFLGGLTTFSSYSLETLRYLESGNIKLALITIFLHNGIGLLAVGLGLGLGVVLLGKVS